MPADDLEPGARGALQSLANSGACSDKALRKTPFSTSDFAAFRFGRMSDVGESAQMIPAPEGLICRISAP
jgi:hypothetical protein